MCFENGKTIHSWLASDWITWLFQCEWIADFCLFELVGAGALIDKGDNTYGGKWVVNPNMFVSMLS